MGPTDYRPERAQEFVKTAKRQPDFSRGTGRGDDTTTAMVIGKLTADGGRPGPGPGHYNTPSAYELAKVASGYAKLLCRAEIPASS